MNKHMDPGIESTQKGITTFCLILFTQRCHRKEVTLEYLISKIFKLDDVRSKYLKFKEIGLYIVSRSSTINKRMPAILKCAYKVRQCNLM